nr:immunoglobulin heavy chain junction region [Mus musculus]
TVLVLMITTRSPGLLT